MRVTLPAAALASASAFHTHCAEVFGFPAFYGRNGDAWIDCMADIDKPDHRMTSIHVEPGATLLIEIPGAARDGTAAAHPELLELLELVACVNARLAEGGSRTRIAVAPVGAR